MGGGGRMCSAVDVQPLLEQQSVAALEDDIHEPVVTTQLASGEQIASSTCTRTLSSSLAIIAYTWRGDWGQGYMYM